MGWCFYCTCVSVSPGEGRGNPLQYSCLENPEDRGAGGCYSPWGLKESDTTEQLNNYLYSPGGSPRWDCLPWVPAVSRCFPGAPSSVTGPLWAAWHLMAQSWPDKGTFQDGSGKFQGHLGQARERKQHPPPNGRSWRPCTLGTHLLHGPISILSPPAQHPRPTLSKGRAGRGSDLSRTLTEKKDPKLSGPRTCGGGEGKGWRVTASPQHTLGLGRCPTKERMPPLESVSVPCSLIVPRGAGVCPERLSEEAHMEASQKPVTWTNWPSHLGGGAGRGRLKSPSHDRPAVASTSTEPSQGDPQLWLQILQQQEDSPPGGGPGL